MEGVSICITAFKSVNFIKECLDSIKLQTYFKKTDEYEIIVGVDGCIETCNYLKGIMNNYKNLKIYMMESNQGTYITTNTIISLAKYNNIIRFDSDDIMLPNMVEYIMANKGFCDIYRFHLQNFGGDTAIYLSEGPIYVKKDFLISLGGFQPWKCSADSEFKARTKNIGKQGLTKTILFKRRVHDESLTRKKGELQVKGGVGSVRREYLRYVDKIRRKGCSNPKITMVINECYEILSDTTIKPLKEAFTKVVILKSKPVKNRHITIKNKVISDATKNKAQAEKNKVILEKQKGIQKLKHPVHHKRRLSFNGVVSW